jgi:hypothetical protein
MNELHHDLQEPVKGTTIQADGIPEPPSSYSGVMNTWKSVKILQFIIIIITENEKQR